MHKAIPVIDLFAGPGGLGEGFSSLLNSDGSPVFKIKLSIEKEELAHQTLTLRSFYRQFENKSIPDDYYEFLKGKITTVDDLFAKWPIQAKAAKKEAWNIELNEANAAIISNGISEVLDGERNWVLIGGPPCQAYSLPGRARMKKNEGKELDLNDIRVHLYKEYLRIIAKHSPAVFVMENVKGILSSKVNNESIFSNILKDLQDPYRAFPGKNNENNIGYSVFSLVKEKSKNKKGEYVYENKDFIIKAEDYGIPQSRHRVIILGVRNDFIDCTPELLSISGPVNIMQVISNLPQLRSELSKKGKVAKKTKKSIELNIDKAEIWKKAIHSLITENLLNEVKETAGKRLLNKLNYNIKHLLSPLNDVGGQYIPCRSLTTFDTNWFFNPNLNGVCNHEARMHMPIDLVRYIYASTFAQVKKRSPKLSDFPQSLLPNHKNVNKDNVNEHFADRFRVQLVDKPASTVTCHLAKDGHTFIHPDPLQCRSLTVREAARIQTFPDDYFFCGTRTAQYIQVGNAVPPLLARQIAKIVKAHFNNISKITKERNDVSSKIEEQSLTEEIAV